MWFAVVLSGGFGAIALGGSLPLAPTSARLVQCGVAMLAAQCLCLSFLFQARHAIYVTVEPPAERPAWFVAIWRRYREAAEECAPQSWPARNPARRSPPLGSSVENDPDGAAARGILL